MGGALAARPLRWRRSIVAPLALFVHLLLLAPTSSAQAETVSFTVGRCDAGRSVWQRSRDSAAVAGHCAQLSMALANLRQDPKASSKYAREARRLVPRGARALLVATHSQLLQGRVANAADVYQRLEAIYEQELDGHRSAVLAQWRAVDWLLAGRAALLAGQWESARDRYRRVVLDLEALGSERLAARALVEAATAAVHADADAALEAEGYLMEAAQQVAPTSLVWVQVASSLLEARLEEKQGASLPRLPPVSDTALRVFEKEAALPQLGGSVPTLPRAELSLWLALALRERDQTEAQRHIAQALESERPVHLRALDRAVMTSLQ